MGVRARPVRAPMWSEVKPLGEVESPGWAQSGTSLALRGSQLTFLSGLPRPVTHANPLRMSISQNLQLIERFIERFTLQEWHKARELLAPDFTGVWPQSREKMNADQYIEVNRRYPGNHVLKIVRAHEVGDLVIATTWIDADTGQKTFVTSYFEVRDGKIASAEEYWAEPYAAPESRRELVELY